MVIGNEQEFRQVVINLVINACHAVDQKGMIQISTSLDDRGNIEIGVRDNGRVSAAKYRKDL